MKINIHLGCSIKAMESMPDKKYGLALVDPEYGIGMDGGNVGYKGNNNFEKKDWDNKPASPEYFELLFSVTDNQIIWGGNYFNLPPSRCFLIWDKGEGFYNRTYAEAELAWTSFDANIKIYKRDPLAKGDYKGKINPCQKPVALYKWLLKNYGFNKDGSKRTIFDSHGGSMSIVIACIDLGFDIDIWEIDEDYYTDAVNRVKRHLAQSDLTREPVDINYIN